MRCPASVGPMFAPGLLPTMLPSSAMSSTSFGARGVEAGAAARDLVVVDQLVLLRIVRIGDRRQQVGEVDRQAAARDRTHHQRTGPLVGAQLDVACGTGCPANRARRVGPVDDIALERVGDPVRVLRTEAVEHRRVVQHHHVGGYGIAVQLTAACAPGTNSMDSITMHNITTASKILLFAIGLVA